MRLQLVKAKPCRRALPVIVAANGNGGFWQRSRRPSSGRHGPYGVWLQAFEQRGDQDASMMPSGYRYDLPARRSPITASTATSAPASRWAEERVPLDVAGNRANPKSIRLAALYGSYDGGDVYANARCRAGTTSHDAQRTIVVGPTSTLNEPARREAAGRFCSARARRGVPGEGGQIRSVNLRYTLVKGYRLHRERQRRAPLVDGRSTHTVWFLNWGLRWTQAFAAVSGKRAPDPGSERGPAARLRHGSRLVQAAYVDARRRPVLRSRASAHRAQPACGLASA